MRPSTVLVISLLLIGLVHTQYTYTFHTSCVGDRGDKTKAAFIEAVAMAQNAVERMSDLSDRVTTRLFQTIFKQTTAMNQGTPIG
jgi:hypothetical protein